MYAWEQLNVLLSGHYNDFPISWILCVYVRVLEGWSGCVCCVCKVLWYVFVLCMCVLCVVL